MKQFLNAESGIKKPQSWADDYHTYVLLRQEQVEVKHNEDEEPSIGYVSDYVQYTHEEFQSLMTQELKSKVLTELDQSIETVRSNKILESKKLLEQFYAQTYLVSAVHKAAGEQYSVTSEKQNYLLDMIALCDQAEELGTEFQPTWNATGEPCEPWTKLELKQLALQIAQFVYPVVSQQQSYEKSINNMKSVEEIQSLVISYGQKTV